MGTYKDFEHSLRVKTSCFKNNQCYCSPSQNTVTAKVQETREIFRFDFFLMLVYFSPTLPLGTSCYWGVCFLPFGISSCLSNAYSMQRCNKPKQNLYSLGTFPWILSCRRYRKKGARPLCQRLTQVDTVPWKSGNGTGLVILVMARRRI